MAVIASAHKISKTFGLQTLFKGITFAISDSQKIGLIGPNGAGKSTLLRILTRAITPDDGDVSFGKNLVVGYLEQNPVFDSGDSVLDAILKGSSDPDDPAHHLKAYELISRFNMDEETESGFKQVSALSGGWLKRVALAREMIKEPQLLLLDEPTNHLDVTSIQWLEDYLARQHQLAYLVITHDRLFLQNTCDMIFDLDSRNPDGLIKYAGTYADFLDLKESLLDSQKTLLSTKKNTLRRETEWLRRGAKARQTKQTARIDRAADLKDDVAQLRHQQRDRSVDFDFGKRDHNPKKIIEIQEAGLERDGRSLFSDFSHIFGGKARTGLIGANGAGKTSLLKMLMGEVEPTSGTIKRAEGLRMAYFSQKKEDLDPKKSALQTICPEGDYIQLHGHPVFAKSYLSRFQFRNDQMDLPVGKLSGGEQSRLLMAQLMMRAEPVLILDEPTNDLDIETLDALQGALTQFPGALILVSHDRYFMDQVCTEILAIDEVNKTIEKFANIFQWSEWIQNRDRTPVDTPKVAPAPTPNPSVSSPKSAAKGARLGFKEQREFEGLPAAIEVAEADLQKLEQGLSDPKVQSDYNRLQELTRELQTKKEQIDHYYKRWQELGERAGST